VRAAFILSYYAGKSSYFSINNEKPG